MCDLGHPTASMILHCENGAVCGNEERPSGTLLPWFANYEMRRVFNAVMRAISSLIGALMVLMGGIWILQGLSLARGSLSRSFMQGDQHWAVYGAIVLVVGICQIIWSNTRQCA